MNTEDTKSKSVNTDRAATDNLSVRKILGDKVSQRRKGVKSDRLARMALENQLVEAAKEAVIREEHCVVRGGRLVMIYSPLESDHSMCEIDTDNGVYVVIRSHNGDHTIMQKRNAPAF